MRLLIFTTCIAVIVAVALAPRHAVAQDEDVSLVINPSTGAASIRNDTSTSVSIDGYLLTSLGSVFNPAGWSTLTGNPSFPGWAQGPAAANRLGEANLLSSLTINGGTSISLGAPYTPFSPSALGQVEPGLKFEYSIDGIGSIEGDVVFAPQNNVVLIVNPATGAASVQNQSTFNVNIDGLLITSTANVLNPTGWNGLAESGVSGWAMGAAATNRLGEGNLLGSTLFGAASAPVSIGSPINPAMISDETDLVFEYHIAGGATVTGGVVLTSAPAVVPLAGDYNSNGAVDTADYVEWRNKVGAASLANRGGGITGPVGQADYNFWKSRFGMTSGSGGSVAAMMIAVPEAGTAALLVAGMTACAIIRRRRRMDS
jgi:hypothetical protein